MGVLGLGFNLDSNIFCLSVGAPPRRADKHHPTQNGNHLIAARLLRGQVVDGIEYVRRYLIVKEFNPRVEGTELSN